MQDEIAGDDSGTEYELVMPFVAAVSNGGRYEDEAFVAGFQAGQLHTKLEAAYQAGATEVVFTIGEHVVRQAELSGMKVGFPMMRAESTIVPQWTQVTFSRNPA
jgi:hypothetical protein